MSSLRCQIGDLVEIVPAWLAMDTIARLMGSSLTRFEIAALLELEIEESSKEAA